MSRRLFLPGWTGRSEVQRVELYTVGTLYVLFWFLIAVGALSAAVQVPGTVEVVVLLVASVVLGAAGTWTLHSSIRLHPERGPVPWLPLGVLVAVVALAEGLVLTLPESARFQAAIIPVGVLGWGAGGLRDRRIQVALYVAFPVLVLSTGQAFFAPYALVFGAFMAVTVQSSLWLLGVVTELDRARSTGASLAVAEERLRFSRDVHDVLGRRLSTIAVQAELAATLAERGDDRAVHQILEVRTTAHDALREARELARGYRPLDLRAEVDGAVALLRSAGIAAHADVADLPEAWHEPVARVIREAVTNVLRHSRATRVELSYVGSEVVIRNDGVPDRVGRDRDGSGLAALTEDLAPLGAGLESGREGEEFVVRVRLAPVSVRAGEPR